MTSSRSRVESERALWALMDTQHGVALTWQLYDAGISRQRVRSLLQQGVLQSVSFGLVRAAGSTLSRLQEVQIGVLLGTPRRAAELKAGACGITAAVMLDMVEERNEDIHILTVRSCTSRAGYRFHRTSRLPASEIVLVERVPCTDAPRTFLDLCYTHPQVAMWAYRRALRKGVLTQEAVVSRIESEARQGRSGIVLAREIVATTSSSAHLAKSGLEDRYFDYFVRAGYPPPQRNVALAGSYGHSWEVDLYFPQIRAGFEISPYETHGTADTHERDSRKSLDLAARGIRIWTFAEPLSFGAFMERVRPLLGPPEHFPRRNLVG